MIIVVVHAFFVVYCGVHCLHETRYYLTRTFYGVRSFVWIVILSNYKTFYGAFVAFFVRVSSTSF